MSSGKVNLPIIEPGATYREKIEWVSVIPLESLSYDTLTSKVIATCRNIHNLITGNKVNIRSVIPYSYNIDFVIITVLDAYRFSYTPLVTPSTPARVFSETSLTVPIDLTDSTASLKIYSQDINNTLLKELTLANGGLTFDATKGIINAFISDEDTVLIPVSTKQLPHRYTLDIFHPNGDTTFLLKGFFSSPCVPKSSNSFIIESSLSTAIVITAPQGAPGISGSGADNIVDYSFSWGDVSPNLLLTVPSGESIVKVEVAILTPFDTVSSLSIGDTLNNQRLFPSNAIDLSIAATYVSNIAYTYVSSENINLYLSPGVGNTQGNGLILIYTT